MTDYRQRAREAEALARQARDAAEREQLMQVARLWRDRADRGAEPHDLRPERPR